MSEIDSNLNAIWNKYFNTALIAAPLTLLTYVVTFVMIAVYGRQIFNGDFATFIVTTLALYWAAIGAVAIYAIWFIIKSDRVFKLLGINRIVANSLNIIGLVVIPGASFLVTPLILWLLVRDHWRDNKMDFNWKSAAI